MIPVPHMNVLVVLALAFVAIAVAGVNAMRQGHGRTVVAYLLAERKASWLRQGGSLFVTTIWSLMCVWFIIPATWKLEGWIPIGAIAAMAMLVLALVFVPLYWNSATVTVPQLIGKRFGRRVGMALSLSAILLTLFVRIPLAIAVGGAVLHYLLGWDLMLTAILAVVVPGLFAVAGGFSAVLATQGVEAIIALGGLAVLAVRGSGTNDFTAGVWQAAAPLNVPLLAGAAAVMGVWYMCVDQFTVQRTLAVRSSEEARKGSITAAVLIVAGVLLLAAGSTTTLMRNSSGEAPQDLAAALLGVAVLSMIMAYVAGHFLSVSAMVTMDVFPMLRPGRDEASLVLVGRLTTSVAAILAVLAALAASVLPSPPLEWLVLPYAVLVPPAAAIALIGLPWPRMHERGARWGLGVGWLTGAVVGGLRLAKGADVGLFPETALMSFLAAALVFVGISFAAGPVAVGASVAQPAFEKGKK